MPAIDRPDRAVDPASCGLTFETVDLARRGLTLELREHAEDVYREAELLFEDPSALKVADVRNLVGALVSATNRLEAFDWPE